MASQIRTLSFKIINSTTKLLPAWKATCVGCKKPERLMPRDVRTRWNSTYDMLDFAVGYSKVIDNMTASKSNGLRRYELSRDEWKVAKQLRNHFKDATSYFESEGSPNLAKVIPAIDQLDKFLTTASGSTKFDHPIQVACELAKKTLNTYYSRTDMSKTYRIAMGMCPFISLIVRMLLTFADSYAPALQDAIF
ncbi:hypothetical protein LXA43DRAFT_903690 [Ganoderma leucocontextum]|nr:hypothetical protein LXA43DRAFT_903690 [Ganoderma leucocontextum]